MIRLLPILLIVYIIKTGNGAPNITGPENGSSDYQQQNSISEGISDIGVNSEEKEAVQDNAGLKRKSEEDMQNAGGAPILETRQLDGQNEGQNQAGCQETHDHATKKCSFGRSFKEGVRKAGSVAIKKLGLSSQQVGPSDNTNSNVKGDKPNNRRSKKAERERRQREAEERFRVPSWEEMDDRRRHAKPKQPSPEASPPPAPPRTADQELSEKLVKLAGKAMATDPNDAGSIMLMNNALDAYGRENDQPFVKFFRPLSPKSKALSAMNAVFLQEYDQMKKGGKRENKEES